MANGQHCLNVSKVLIQAKPPVDHHPTFQVVTYEVKILKVLKVFLAPQFDIHVPVVIRCLVLIRYSAIKTNSGHKHHVANVPAQLLLHLQLRFQLHHLLLHHQVEVVDIAKIHPLLVMEE